MTCFFKKITIISILLFSVSCANNKGWVYKTNNYEGNIQINENNKYLKNKSMAVLPFKDRRLSSNKNYLLLYMVPVVPFGYQNLNLPETSQTHLNSGLWLNYDPKEDFAKAMAQELANIDFFEEAVFSNSYKGYDYYVKGEIISTNYEGKLYSYGLSIYGPLLWYFGFPATTVTNDLEIKLSLIDSKSKNVIFSKTYKADQYKKTGWIYNIPSDFSYSEMLKVLYKQFVEDLLKVQNS